MTNSGTAAMKSIVDKLVALLEREPTTRGEELERLVEEKDSLVSQLEQCLVVSEP